MPNPPTTSDIDANTNQKQLIRHQFHQKRQAEERQHLAIEDDADDSYQDEPDQLQALVDGQPQ